MFELSFFFRLLHAENADQGKRRKKNPLENENIFVTYCSPAKNDTQESFWRCALMTMFPTNIMGEELIKKANEYAKEYKFLPRKEKQSSLQNMKNK